MESKEGYQVVVFRSGEAEYGADIRDVREIIRLDTITSIPGSGKAVEGIINVRGEIVPLINLRSLTDIPYKSPDKDTRVLIVDQKPVFGLIVDTVGEVKNMPGESIVPVPSIIRGSLNNDLFTGICKLPDRILIIMDLKRVFNGNGDSKTADAAAAAENAAKVTAEQHGNDHDIQPPVAAAEPAAEPAIGSDAPVNQGETAQIVTTMPTKQPIATPDTAIINEPGVGVEANQASPAPVIQTISDPNIDVMVPDNRMTEVHLDALREVGNIGTSHAATSLSQLVGSPINMSVPHLKLVSISNISSLMNELKVVGLLLELKNGDATAGFLYNLFPESSALRIVDRLMGLESGTTRDLDEMSQSAIMEVGNIITSSFCDAVADFLGITMIPSPPSFVCDMADSIVENTLIEISMMADEVIIFRTDLADDEHIFEGYVLMFPNPDTLEKILSIIDAKLGLV
ncbi:MAG TPA: chemotaxis protein CheW [Methanocella sp.]|nr:chemotaxis protein CheW [Methanocella sp.]